MALGKKHEVKVIPEAYLHLIIGEKKVGKSTLVSNIAKDYYGSLDTLLSISVGKEDGFSAIDGLIYESPQIWKEFVKLVDELVDNPDENDFKIVSIDTIDELVSLGIQEVMRLSNIETSKKCTSINDAFGGYGRGREKLAELITTQLTRLKGTKYGLFLIGHNKVKNQKEKMGDEYMVVTSNLSNDYFNIFGYKADIVCSIISEKDIDDDKHLTGTSRYMYFRSDGYVEAGSRFSEMPTRVEYGAMNYVNAIVDGIKKSLGKDLSEKEIQKRATVEHKEKEEKAKEFASAAKEPTFSEKIEKLTDRYVNYDKPEVKKEFKKKLVELGYAKLTELDTAQNEEHLKILEGILK